MKLNCCDRCFNFTGPSMQGIRLYPILIKLDYENPSIDADTNDGEICIDCFSKLKGLLNDFWRNEAKLLR